MSGIENQPEQAARHRPVMLDEVLAALEPTAGEMHVDGTFGAGGYSRGILDAADCKVIAIDQDPNAIRDGQDVVAACGGRLSLLHGRFSEMEDFVSEGAVQGVVLDIGVSSMQLDEATRGFSFMRDGPLDMRMAQAGESAADVVRTRSAEDLANIIFEFGEESRSRAIGRAIVKAREEAAITTTRGLVAAIERATGPHRPHIKTHPATKTFQALRIYVNRELDELTQGLDAAERILAEGGRLVVVTFHSLEDRIVKRFFAERSGNLPSPSRHAPQAQSAQAPSFELFFKGHIAPSEAEIAINPRARSAKLRAGRRTSAPAFGRRH
jgi:16S rRNA (cytosine1402-N4)-methyltransferase